MDFSEPQEDKVGTVVIDGEVFFSERTVRLIVLPQAQVFLSGMPAPSADFAIRTVDFLVAEIARKNLEDTDD